MINILMDVPNQYYRDGMNHLLADLFLHEYGEDINLNNAFTHYNIWNADLIIFSIRRGEAYTCKNEFRYRNRGIMIALTNSDPASFQRKPLCYRDMVQVSCKTSPELMYSEIVKAWNKNKSLSHYPQTYSCTGCPCVWLTTQQALLAREWIAGTPARKIALKLKMGLKTVYTHKYLMMKKFNLDNNKDLFILLDYLLRRDDQKGLSRNGCDTGWPAGKTEHRFTRFP